MPSETVLVTQHGGSHACCRRPCVPWSGGGPSSAIVNPLTGEIRKLLRRCWFRTHLQPRPAPAAATPTAQNETDKMGGDRGILRFETKHDEEVLARVSVVVRPAGLEVRAEEGR